MEQSAQALKEEFNELVISLTNNLNKRALANVKKELEEINKQTANGVEKGLVTLKQTLDPINKQQKKLAYDTNVSLEKLHSTINYLDKYADKNALAIKKVFEPIDTRQIQATSNIYSRLQELKQAIIAFESRSDEKMANHKAYLLNIELKMDTQQSTLNALKAQQEELTNELYNKLDSRISGVRKLLILTLLLVIFLVILPLGALIFFGFREIIPYV